MALYGTRTMPPKRVTARQLRAHCLELLDEVAETGRPLEITKRGQVIARLEAPDSEIRDLRGSVLLHLTDDELVDASMGPWDIES